MSKCQDGKERSEEAAAEISEGEKAGKARKAEQVIDYYGENLVGRNRKPLHELTWHPEGPQTLSVGAKTYFRQMQLLPLN